MENELPKRKPTRLHYFDYNSSGAYFLTICTENRRNILSRIVGCDVLGAPKTVELSPCGKIIEKYIKQLDEFYDNIKVDRYVIMPNHIHILLRVRRSGAPGTSHPTRQDLTIRAGGAPGTSHPTRQDSTVSSFVSTFKRFCNKELGKNIWQISFYDHIIRNQKDYENHVKYILENPDRWYFDELYSE